MYQNAQIGRGMSALASILAGPDPTNYAQTQAMIAQGRQAAARAQLDEQTHDLRNPIADMIASGDLRGALARGATLGPYASNMAALVNMVAALPDSGYSALDQSRLQAGGGVQAFGNTEVGQGRSIAGQNARNAADNAARLEVQRLADAGALARQNATPINIVGPSGPTISTQGAAVGQTPVLSENDAMGVAVTQSLPAIIAGTLPNQTADIFGGENVDLGLADIAAQNERNAANIEGQNFRHNIGVDAENERANARLAQAAALAAAENALTERLSGRDRTSREGVADADRAARKQMNDADNATALQVAALERADDQMSAAGFTSNQRLYAQQVFKRYMDKGVQVDPALFGEGMARVRRLMEQNVPFDVALEQVIGQIIGTGADIGTGWMDGPRRSDPYRFPDIASDPLGIR